ncbi:MAG TPA: DUF5672 family protein [Tepidisphaeraceae bacterium]|jgi:hypothetical protein
MPLPRLDRVTLCCVDTDHPVAGLRAIRRSMSQCHFGRSIFFASEPISEPGVDCRLIPRFKSIEEYSTFILKGLAPVIQTDFVLMIHWDGYVIDGSRWSDNFLEFDYIGAPWPFSTEHQVGNGGFSLRSRRLLQWLASSHLEYVHPEDAVICKVYRSALEKHGMRFADVETAFRFSVEHGEPPGATLGFHGVFNLWRFLPPGELGPFLDLLPASHIHGENMTKLLIRYLGLNRFDEAQEILSRREMTKPAL